MNDLFEMYLQRANILLQTNETGSNNLMQDTLIPHDEIIGKSEELCNACSDWIVHSMYERRFPIEDEEKNDLFEMVDINVFEQLLINLSSAVYVQAAGIVEQSKFILQRQAIEYATFL